LTLVVLGLVAIAVGDEMAIAHPGDDATLGFTILTFGGPALFLLAQVVFLYEALGRVPRSRPLGLAALALLAIATAPLTLIVGIAASTAVLVAIAIADTVRDGDQAPSRVGVAAPAAVADHPGARFPRERAIDRSAVAGYLAKYAAKSIEDTGRL
jgi:Bacterial low temperature requirement A protein (LtrA)